MTQVIVALPTSLYCILSLVAQTPACCTRIREKSPSKSWCSRGRVLIEIRQQQTLCAVCVAKFQEQPLFQDTFSGLRRRCATVARGCGFVRGHDTSWSEHVFPIKELELGHAILCAGTRYGVAGSCVSTRHMWTLEDSGVDGSPRENWCPGSGVLRCWACCEKIKGIF